MLDVSILHVQGREQFTHFDLMAVDDLANWPAILADPAVQGNIERWTKERIGDARIQIEIIVLVGERRFLKVGRVPAIGVLPDECLPRRTPTPCQSCPDNS